VFHEIDAFGHTEGEITFSALDFLNRQLSKVPSPVNPDFSGPTAHLPGSPVFVHVDTREQFKLFPPFLGVEAGYVTFQLLPAAQGTRTGARLLVIFNSIDVGLGYKGKAVVPPLGITKEFSVVPLRSPYVRELFKSYPSELRQVFRGGYGPLVTRDELLARGAFIESAILFPRLQGLPLVFREPAELPDFPIPKPPTSTIINPHDC